MKKITRILLATLALLAVSTVAIHAEGPVPECAGENCPPPK